MNCTIIGCGASETGSVVEAAGGGALATSASRDSHPSDVAVMAIAAMPRHISRFLRMSRILTPVDTETARQ